MNQVVVVGYGTQRKRDVTGAITSVKGEDIAKFTATNPMAALQGSVAGLSVVNSGTPGASPVVRIRGVASTNNADPLYVVDGLLQTNIDFLNPNDIETIDLLKDASSNAIYGLKGANGVIAITTKRAAKGKTSVSFQTNFGIQHVANKIDVVDAAGFKKLYNAQLANLNAAPFDYTNYTANTNWQDLILRNATINTNNLTVSNNNDKSTTVFNVGYSDQQGVVKYGDYKNTWYA
ncbi:TonB-dependent receptor plug domain-containing protein [Mucilaginibacter humi]|uniref:TonB-dependent receptor plug domain-containing protein n=1 Tax=Mucilaginibacter humi TaxID=2732510 RepID=UPI001FE5140B|nr:TonB-dependent receptor plug domain-containing protein [Mucilaginibacter humi]